MTHELLKPFGFPPPWNNDPKTFNNARPLNVYDYEGVLDYTYDTLQFGGMTVDQLQHYLEERQTRDRTFVGVQLHGIGTSAWIKVTINVPGGRCYLDRIPPCQPTRLMSDRLVMRDEECLKIRLDCCHM